MSNEQPPERVTDEELVDIERRIANETQAHASHGRRVAEKDRKRLFTAVLAARAEIERLKRQVEGFGRVVAEMGKDEIPCGHTVADLIGGTETAPDGTTRPCVTKCGACLALRQDEIAARRKERAKEQEAADAWKALAQAHERAALADAPSPEFFAAAEDADRARDALESLGIDYEAP